MKAIYTLLKIGQKNLDQLVIQKKILSTKLEETISALELHQLQVSEEYKKYLNSEYGIFLEKYLKAAKQKTSNFNNQIMVLKSDIEQVETQILDLFAEMKRYEIIISNNKKLQVQKEQKLETKQLDEFVISKINNS